MASAPSGTVHRNAPTNWAMITTKLTALNTHPAALVALAAGTSDRIISAMPVTMNMSVTTSGVGRAFVLTTAST
jgi:hypothetical protein